MEPKIRFKGFDSPLDKSLIGDICLISTGKSNTQDKIDDGIYPFYVRSPHIEKSNKYLYDEEAVLTVGDGVGTGKVFHYVNGKYDLHQRVYRMFNFKDINAKFFYYLFSQKFYKRVMSMTAKSSVDSVRLDMISEMGIETPSIDEQKAIASYFTSLDSQISAATSRLASLKQMKAASLQAMFPQEGETVPKIRFKGFEGEWKKVMFSETFEFLKNNSLSRAELSNEGDIVNVHYGDVLIKYGDLLNIQNEELTFIADNKIGNTLYNSCHLQNGDIIIADAAEDNTVGKCSEIVNICNKRVVSGLHTIPCRPLNRFAQGYLGHYINSESYHNQLLPLIQGSKISSISKKTLSQTIVLVPSIEEQKCIGNYFTSLDRQISLQSQRLEKLKQIKSACLDKMFV